MRILITGGWGFTGSRLAQYLHQVGHTVVLASRVLHKRPEWLPDAETIVIDWRSRESMQLACRGADMIVHTAGMNAKDCETEPVVAFEVNGTATGQLIDAAISESVKRFIYLSTVHVYANSLVGQISDLTIPRNSHPYATSHLVGENALLKAQKKGDIQGIVLRLSNVLGPPAHKNANCWMLLANELCKKVIQTNRIEIKSSGLQFRDFIPMSEVCRAIGFLAGNNLALGCYNLCSEYSISVLAIAQLIQKRCGIVLNTQPSLHTFNVKLEEKYEVLNIEMSGLKKIGFHVDSDLTAEIDSLLVACKKWFFYKNKNV